VDKVIVSEYKDGEGKDVPEHIIDVPTAEEILVQGAMNIANTTEAIRRRVLIAQNGDVPHIGYYPGSTADRVLSS
jgi:hypothetical protein